MNGRRLLVVFDDADAMVAAARQLRRDRVRDLDAHTPYRIEALDEALDLPPSPVRPVMLIAALAAAAAMFGLQYWTSVYEYPINSGGRPPNSWPAFAFAVFEMAVLGAAFAGFVTMLWLCGLPRLHHPFFAVAGAEAASDDRFYLSLPSHAVLDRAALLRLPGAVELVEVGA